MACVATRVSLECLPAGWSLSQLAQRSLEHDSVSGSQDRGLRRTWPPSPGDLLPCWTGHWLCAAGASPVAVKTGHRVYPRSHVPMPRSCGGALVDPSSPQTSTAECPGAPAGWEQGSQDPSTHAGPEVGHTHPRNPGPGPAPRKLGQRFLRKLAGPVASRAPRPAAPPGGLRVTGRSTTGNCCPSWCHPRMWPDTG